MKNKTLKIVTAALGVFCLASCGENVSKTDIKNFTGIGYQERDFVGIKNLNQILTVGKSQQILIDAMPANYAGKVKFESLDKTIVEVSESGLLNPLKEGHTRVLVKDGDNNLVCKLHVLVAKDDETNTRNALQNIKNSYGAGYSAPTKVHKFEFSWEDYYKDGVVDHGYTSNEEMFYDKENAIFFLGGDDVMRYTRGGAREVAVGNWYFEVLDMKTRMVHITANSKNYYDFNSASYGLQKYRAIEDVLDLFFVSGKSIINDMLDEYSGKETFFEFCDYYKTDPGLTIVADNDNDISAKLTYRNESSVVDIEDELRYLDMYEGTPYIANTDIGFMYTGNKCVGYDVYATYDYEFEGSKWQREFSRSMAFDEDYEPIVFDYDDKEMQELGFIKVDQMYDL